MFGRKNRDEAFPGGEGILQLYPLPAVYVQFHLSAPGGKVSGVFEPLSGGTGAPGREVGQVPREGLHV